jgi:uncharacterized BrkB/YihY/UPF0761 family membrane protein
MVKTGPQLAEEKADLVFDAKSSERLRQIEIMPRNFIRLIAKLTVVVGLFLLVRVIYHTASGSLLAQLFPETQQSWANNLYAIFLSLPVSLHVISIGFVLQRSWLPPHWLSPAAGLALPWGLKYSCFTEIPKTNQLWTGPI